MIITINGRQKQRNPVVGLALSGGGIRGVTHIGVLKVLLENKIPIHMIAGTSAGAIVASLYACGYTPEQMCDIAMGIKVNELIDIKVTVAEFFKHGMNWFFKGKNRFWSAFPSGIIKGDKIEQFFSSLWQNRTVRDTKIPIAITAVDIHSGNTIFFSTPVPDKRAILNAQYFHNSFLTDAVRASISVPGIFIPKKYRGMLLVDGAVKNNVPADILHYMGADVIISVDLGYSGQPNDNISTVSEIVLQCIDIMSREVTLLKGECYSDIVIRPPIFDINFKDFTQIALCIQKGEEATQNKLHDILKLL